ncbi:hypothetical protein B9Q00_01055 [Candidatus Marsarchaeota G1 archaeon OSP_C]|jgi:hypothetical protein|uniref:Type II secretion system protein GspF domain-containing protein n=1 Tax=Candidatus Marsarchaeota G1 archaeon OSP_C TaxID=1978154 RepID=A0A2R6ATF1_9ARCH|nr:MAG: hypothetical protein B9Q00_01055 [Candidatus Marsarchaeota G1 archaeon OSP_C]
MISNKLLEEANAELSRAKIKRIIRKRVCFSLAISTIIGFILYKMTHIFVSISIIPVGGLIGFFSLMFELLLQRNRRETLVEKELPFVSTVLAMGANHVPPFSVLKNLIELHAFSQTKKEYFTILKKAKTEHVTLSRAAALISEIHPSARFQEFLKSISASERGVGDPYYSLRDLSKTELSTLSHKVELSQEKFGVASSLILVSFAIVPLTMMVFSLITGNTQLLYLTSLLSLPAAFGANLLIEQAYPLGLKPEPKKPSRFLLTILALLLVLCFVVFFSWLKLPLHLAIGVSLLLCSIPFSLFYSKHSSEHSQSIKLMPSIARDLAEEAKKGYPPSQSIGRLTKKYPKKILMNLYNVEDKPYLTKAYVALLKQAEKLGAQPEQLDIVAETMNVITNAHSTYNSKANLFRMMVYGSVVIFTTSSVIVIRTISELARKMSAGLSLSAIALLHPSPSLKGVVYVAVVVNSYLLGILAGKAVKGSLLFGFVDAIITTLLALFLLNIGGWL